MVGERTIALDTNYGEIVLCIKEILAEKNMSMYKLSVLTGIKYDIIYNYCNNFMQRYDKDVLAKIWYSDLISYIPSNNNWFYKDLWNMSH